MSSRIMALARAYAETRTVMQKLTLPTLKPFM